MFSHRLTALCALWISALTLLRATEILRPPFLTVTFYYSSFLISFLVLAIFDLKKIKFNLYWLPFYIFAVISIVSGAPSAFFRPWERYVSFCVITFAIGPLIESPLLIEFRKKIFSNIFKLICIGCITSFFLWFLQSPIVFHKNSPLLRGIFVHSMTLSPLAALVILYVARGIFSLQIPIKKRALLGAVALISFLVLLLSASRAAFLALIGALICFLAILYQGKKKSLTICTGSILLAMAVSSPLWNPYLENMEKKMERDEIQEGVDPMRSRKNLWALRIVEFKAKPLLGSGFASVDLSVADAKVDREKGIVESGNGWLFVLSSTGLCGFLALALPIFTILAGLYRKREGPRIQRAYSFAAIVFFIVHAMAEGYIISSGSILFMLFWLHLFYGWHLLRHAGEQPFPAK